MRRVLPLVIALFLLAACNGENMNDKDPDDSTKHPTARSQADGVEIWNLQDPPSTTALGIPEDSAAGIYETQEPRTVRFDLPGGTRLTVKATLVTFERFGDGETARFTVGVRTAQLEPDALVATFRDVLGQLEVSTDAADQLAADLKAAPDDQTEHIIVGSDTVTLGNLRIGAQADVAPIAGAGPVIIGGSWQ